MRFITKGGGVWAAGPLAAAMLLAAACGGNISESSDGPPLDVGVTAQSKGSGGSGGDGSGGGGAGTGKLAPLNAVAIPAPSGGDIKNQAAAVRLGKALFWDAQAGGDGKTACASCHFSAGADNRTLNTLATGADGLFTSAGVTAAGQQATRANISSDDRWGSQGVAAATFSGVDPDPTHAADLCTATPSAPFFQSRQVTGRNAPSVVAAVFFRDQFWDGRGNHNFNGNNPFGQTGNNSDGSSVVVTNSSLASQADGPANNPVEMACGGRTFGNLGAKLLARTPLGTQHVSAQDSVLGALANTVGAGLTTTYSAMITAAFGAPLANAASFSRVWGQAVQAYESTLVPDQTPLDRYLAGITSALTPSQQKGLDRFTGKGGCTNCHAGSELSDATVSFAAARGLINEDGGDQGFHNLGVRPTGDDPGRAGTGPGGVPWSVSRSARDNGAFKTPALRNVKLTGPYFHNGGKATLRDVVDFYNRGGDFANAEKASRIKPLSLDSGDVDSLVDFLSNGLTDCRTEKQRAPFDHPSLGVPNGTDLAAVGATGTGSCP